MNFFENFFSAKNPTKPPARENLGGGEQAIPESKVDDYSTDEVERLRSIVNRRENINSRISRLEAELSQDPDMDQTELNKLREQLSELNNIN